MPFPQYNKGKRKLIGIFAANVDKDFVKRLLVPEAYPRVENADGTYSTHLMSSGDKMAYPEITGGPKGHLVDMRKDRAKARRIAMKKGEYIKFGSDREAEWFATNYKKAVKGLK